MVVEYNYSYDNGGPGLWNDINSEGVTYDENETFGNIEAGILSEISTNITVSGNYIFNDGFNPSGTGPWWGAGILIVDSNTVSVYSNTVVNCMNGIVGRDRKPRRRAQRPTLRIAKPQRRGQYDYPSYRHGRGHCHRRKRNQQCSLHQHE